MKPYPNDLAASLADQLDNAIGVRDRKRGRKRAEYTRQRKFMEDFAAYACDALNLGAEAINRRAQDLGFDASARVETKCDFENDDSMSVMITVSMTRLRRGGAMRISDRAGSVPYRWTLHTSVRIGDQGDAQCPSFEITAHRDGWQDGWGCDIPTPECNPAGLSLTSSGEDVAQRFMAWFTTYVTPS